MYFTSNIPGRYNGCKFKKADRKGNSLGFYDTNDENDIVMLLTSSWYKNKQIKSADEETANKILGEINKASQTVSPIARILSASTNKPMTEPAEQKSYVQAPAVKLNRKQLIAKAKEVGINGKDAFTMKNVDLEKKLGIVYPGE